MALGDVFNPMFLRNVYSSCLSLLPSGCMRYANTHMDTVPKFLTHTLVLMVVCNFFLLLSSLSVSFLTFLACLLLSVQNVSILLAATPQGQQLAPRLFAPTEFMLGVCLGITIGGTILSFFVCLTFGRIHAYCAHHTEGPDSCGWRAGSLNGVWWWSSCIFWLDLICCFLLALGHGDISSQSTTQQYQSLDTDDPSMMGSGGQQQSYNQNQYQGGQQQQQAPAFAQRQQQQQGSYASGGYNNVPDVQSEAPPNASHPLQTPNVLSV
mmetsp:Transcript_36726/g.104512  ORF Transcript_36726/g.104512 Transcript_36726/m.104512 type:complete len:266 (-) Transcript_36726:101-898(-)